MPADVVLEALWYAVGAIAPDASVFTAQAHPWGAVGIVTVTVQASRLVPLLAAKVPAVNPPDSVPMLHPDPLIDTDCVPPAIKPEMVGLVAKTTLPLPVDETTVSVSTLEEFVRRRKPVAAAPCLITL